MPWAHNRFFITGLGNERHGAMPADVVKRLEFTLIVSQQEHRPSGNIHRQYPPAAYRPDSANHSLRWLRT